MGNIQLVIGERIAPAVMQAEMDRLALIAQPGTICLLALEGVPLNFVQLPIFYKPAPRPAEYERHIKVHARIPERLHPIIMAGPGAVVILSIAKHLLDLPGFQILSYAHRPDKRCAHDALVLEWEIQQDRDSLVGALLVFCRYIEKDIFPTISPVVWQMIGDPLRTFGEKKEFHIRALRHDLPRFVPPWVCFLQEEIACHTDTDHFSAFDLVVSLPILLQRVFEIRFCLVNVSTIFIPQAV